MLSEVFWPENFCGWKILAVTTAAPREREKKRGRKRERESGVIQRTNKKLRMTFRFRDLQKDVGIVMKQTERIPPVAEF